MKLVAIYKEIFIFRHQITGMYNAFVSGHGTFKADTLKGVKSLIYNALYEKTTKPNTRAKA